jgi:hypothetical protein
MRTKRPVSFAGAIIGSLAMIVVAVFMICDAIRPLRLGRPAAVVELCIALLPLAYTASVGVVANGRFGRVAVTVHIALALPIVVGAALFAHVGIRLLAEEHLCGVAAGIAMLSVMGAILLAMGLLSMEVHCLRRRTVQQGGSLGEPPVAG